MTTNEAIKQLTATPIEPGDYYTGKDIEAISTLLAAAREGLEDDARMKWVDENGVFPILRHWRSDRNFRQMIDAAREEKV